MTYCNGSIENDKAADELSLAVAMGDVEKVRKFLEVDNYSPNSIRTPGGEEYYQPDHPLKMVVFRLSDCFLNDKDYEKFAVIAKLLIQYGADPIPAMIIAEERYGLYPGESADIWDAWHIIARAATLSMNRKV